MFHPSVSDGYDDGPMIKSESRIRCIVAGSRAYSDYEFAKTVLDICLFRKDCEIVSGSCNTGVLTFTRDDGTKVYGADGIGERYAKEKGFPVTIFPPDWGKFGKSAGPIRNTAMAVYSHLCVLFWDGKSKGSADMKKKCGKYEVLLFEEII